MTLTETLRINEGYLKFEDLGALDYCEKRWQESGRPMSKWEMVNFLERMLQELKANGPGYPRVLLLRKKEIQRNAFTIEKPNVAAKQATDVCPICRGQGWKLAAPSDRNSGYVPCECSAGEPHRKQLLAFGMSV